MYWKEYALKTLSLSTEFDTPFDGAANLAPHSKCNKPACGEYLMPLSGPCPMQPY